MEILIRAVLIIIINDKQESCENVKELNRKKKEGNNERNSK